MKMLDRIFLVFRPVRLFLSLRDQFPYSLYQVGHVYVSTVKLIVTLDFTKLLRG